MARFVVEAVESLDLRAIEDSYAGRGELAYRPKMLVALERVASEKADSTIL